MTVTDTVVRAAHARDAAGCVKQYCRPAYCVQHRRSTNRLPITATLHTATVWAQHASSVITSVSDPWLGRQSFQPCATMPISHGCICAFHVAPLSNSVRFFRHHRTSRAQRPCPAARVARSTPRAKSACHSKREAATGAGSMVAPHGRPPRRLHLRS